MQNYKIKLTSINFCDTILKVVLHTLQTNETNLVLTFNTCSLNIESFLEEIFS